MEGCEVFSYPLLTLERWGWGMEGGEVSYLSLTLERWGWWKEGGEVSCILSHYREVGVGHGRG